MSPRPACTLCVVVALSSACSQPAPPAPRAWLTDVTAASGVDFVHASGAAGGWVLTEIMGGGAALFDADGDGHLDLLLLQGGADPTSPVTAQAGGGHRLYLGDGALGFRDATAESGLAGLVGYAMGAAVGDYDGDGRLDVLLTQRGTSVLLRNVGGGRFVDVTREVGAAVEGWSTAAAFADLDGDGDLDLFIVRYLELDPTLVCRDGAGRRTYCPPDSGPPVHDVLLRNDGGRFVDVTAIVGLAARAGAGLGVVVEDLTGDGLADVYVANDGDENHLWVRPSGPAPLAVAWRDEGLARGAALNANGMAEASMGVVAEDFDGDLVPDLFMAHLTGEQHTLYRGRNGSFVDETGRRGLAAVTKPGTGFGVAALDIEADGDLDLLVAHGRVSIGPRAAGATAPAPWDLLAEPNLALTNDGGGNFRAERALVAAFTEPVTIDRAIVYGDLDGDLDLDLVVTRIEGPPLVLRNDAPRAGQLVRFDPRAGAESATALGARVTVEAAGRRFARTVRASDGYLGSRDPRPTFGVPSAATAVEVEVCWPDGHTERFVGLVPNGTHILVRGTGR